MKSYYDRVADIGRRKEKILYVSTFLTLLLTLDKKYNFSNTHKSLKDYVELVIIINTILIVLYILSELRENYIFLKADRIRTLQYIDNSFDTNFAGKSIENYFTQDKLNPGFYKSSVNCFENTFHTFNVAKEMQIGVYAKAFAVFIIFMFSAVVGDKDIVRYLTEAILPLYLVQNAIRLSIFVSRLDNLRETFTTFFTNVRESGFENREPEALKNIITYESTLAWASTPLNSKIFFRMRDKLAEEWEELKEQYHIK